MQYGKHLDKLINMGEVTGFGFPTTQIDIIKNNSEGQTLQIMFIEKKSYKRQGKASWFVVICMIFFQNQDLHWPL